MSSASILTRAHPLHGLAGAALRLAVVAGAHERAAICSDQNAASA